MNKEVALCHLFSEPLLQSGRGSEKNEWFLVCAPSLRGDGVSKFVESLRNQEYDAAILMRWVCAVWNNGWTLSPFFS
jgi:hypothetical protein